MLQQSSCNNFASGLRFNEISSCEAFLKTYFSNFKNNNSNFDNFRMWINIVALQQFSYDLNFKFLVSGAPQLVHPPNQPLQWNITNVSKETTSSAWRFLKISLPTTDMTCFPNPKNDMYFHIFSIVLMRNFPGTHLSFQVFLFFSFLWNELSHWVSEFPATHNFPFHQNSPRVFFSKKSIWNS